MLEYDNLWRFIKARGCHVQEYEELKHVFNLIRGSESYLEVGSAEGNSMYVLGNALADGADIAFIDLGEKHTTPDRDQIIGILTSSGYKVKPIIGNTMHRACIEEAQKRCYDVVMIDAGHDYDEVLSDAQNYGPLATKYILFHDVKLPEVKRAIDEWRGDRDYYEFINSESFGYGIVKV